MTTEITTTNCDYCSNLAIANYQKVWIKWKVFKNGDYSKSFKPQFDIEEPIGTNNIHVCEIHEVAFLNGEL